jgi:hypothetical protein
LNLGNGFVTSKYTYCPILLNSGKSVKTKETLAKVLENTFKNESVGESTD